jgi:hypothetical protein
VGVAGAGEEEAAGEELRWIVGPRRSSACGPLRWGAVGGREEEEKEKEACATPPVTPL